MKMSEGRAYMRPTFQVPKRKVPGGGVADESAESLGIKLILGSGEGGRGGGGGR